MPCCYFGWLSSCIIRDTEHLILWLLRIGFVLFFPLKVCEENLPVIVGLLKVSSLCNLSAIPAPGTFLRAAAISSPINSVQFSRSVMSNSSQPHGLQHSRFPCPSPTPGAYSNSCPLSWWCHLTISSSVVLFSSRLQSFPASGSFPSESVLHIRRPSIRVSASESVLPMNIQDGFPLGWTDWVSFQSKGLSRVFSSTTVQKHQFFCTQLFYSPTLTTIHYWKNHSID